MKAVSAISAALVILAGCGLVSAAYDPSRSCSGFCGSVSSNSDFSSYCYCDDYCTYNGDCCDDVTTICKGSPPQSASCNGFCGSYNSGGGCYCDSICSSNPYGDCCSDWSSYCQAPPTEGSCNGNCGGCASADYGSYGSQCCCDDLCTFLGDCCNDKGDYCGSSPSPAGGSCSGYCTQYWNADQSCHCDTVCTEYGDCCGDYDEECGAANSCQNHCGDAYVGNCHCDAISTLYQDSCADYNQYCALPPPPISSSPSPPKDCSGAQGTCSGNCGSNDPDYFCYCDDFCTYAGDCCCDVETYCPVSPTASGSCLNKCGSSSTKSDGSVCYCDDYCTYNGDCCDDHSSLCSFPPPPPDVAADCVSGGVCGSYYSAFSCGCDDACTAFGDCCDGYADCTKKFNSDGDTQDNAIEITSLPFHYEGSTDGHTDTAQVPAGCATDYDYEQSGVDIWFVYTPTSDVSVNISLCGEGGSKSTNFDSYVYVEKKSSAGTVGVACNDDGDRDGCGLSSELTVNFAAGETYYIIIDGYGPSDKGDFALDVDNKVGNTIDDAIPVTTLPFEYNGNTQGFDDTYTPPQECASSSNAADVVFRLSLTKFTTVSLSLCGSDFDNILYVMDSTQKVLEDECNDDNNRDGCDGDAFLTLDITPFAVYYIVVDGFDTDSGEFRLQVTELPGNNAQNAILISSIPYDVSGDTTEYTNEFKGPLVAGCEAESTAPDVFYKIFTFQQHDLRIDLCTPDFDSVLYVYTQGSEQSIIVDQCNDDAERQGCSQGSSVKVKVSPFTSYYVVVDGKGTGSGSYQLTIQENTGDSVDDPLVINNLPYVFDGKTTGYTHTMDIPDSCLTTGKSVSNSKDIFFEYYSPQTQTVNITTCGTDTDTIVAVYTKSSEKLSLVKCNDDAQRTGCGSASELSLNLDPLTYYYVVIDVLSDDDENYRLEINSSLRP